MFQHIENNIYLLSRFFNFFSLVENKTYIKKTFLAPHLLRTSYCLIDIDWIESTPLLI